MTPGIFVWEPRKDLTLLLVTYFRCLQEHLIFGTAQSPTICYVFKVVPGTLKFGSRVRAHTAAGSKLHPGNYFSNVPFGEQGKAPQCSRLRGRGDSQNYREHSVLERTGTPRNVPGCVLQAMSGTFHSGKTGTFHSQKVV